MATETSTVKVWDPLVRIGHWALVTAFFVAYFTEDDLLQQHVLAGYTVAGIVLFRAFWGFVGSKNARFANFVRSPGTTLRYLGDIARNRAKRYIGHNPAGGAMIVALLASLAATTWSGLEIYAIEENAGPLAGIYANESVGSLRLEMITTARASEDDSDHEGNAHGRNAGLESAEELWEEVHEVAANLTLFLIVLHVAGVLLASMTHRENLVKAMFTGRRNAQGSLH